MIVALAGRRVDPEGFTPPRFPADHVDLVSERIRAALRQHQATALVSSAACGADLLAQQAAAGLGLRRRVVLASARAAFRETSVTDRPGDWGPLYDRMLDALPPADLIILAPHPDRDQTYREVNLRILDEARKLALEASQPAAAMLVWNLVPRGPDDITEHFRREAAARGMPVFDISTL